MIRTFSTAVLLGATALATPVHAQEAELAAMRARIEQLEARIAEMEGARPAEAAAAAAAAPSAAAAPPVVTAASPLVPAAAPAPSWRGAPQQSAPGGWSFKPRGRIHYDVGYVGAPEGLIDPGLGFSNRLRRARLGAEGTIPGGFGYRLEVDFASGGADIVEALLTYRASPRTGFTIGQHNNFQSLDRITSSNVISFMERAAFTTAFGFERRLGLSANHESGPLLVQGGIFTDDVAALASAARGSALGDENKTIGASARLVYAPKLGETQLHFGGSAHVRDLGSFADANTPTRYRARPFLRTHDTRFLSTPVLRVEQESHWGLEAALLRGPFHAAGEVHWLRADTRGGAAPTLFGGYAELGWFLTGETRGYRTGAFDRTRVLRPVDSGGFGAVQLNLRYDHLDLGRGGVPGGSQDALLASLIWMPQDHVRFLLNYGRLSYDDAAIPAADGRRDYNIEVIGARAQIDF